MIYNIVYSDMSKKDIDDIYRYIAYSLLVPNVAKKQIARIIDAISTLETLPHRYKLYDKEPFKSRGLRWFRVDKYIVFYYLLDEKT